MQQQLIMRLMLLLLAALALLPPASCESTTSAVKMRYSNPVVSAVVDGADVNLIVTTDIDGVWVCLDLNTSKSATSLSIDFDYARKLLRYQLQALERHPTMRVIKLPALSAELQASVKYFGFVEQSVAPSAIEYFLLGANASGFIGFGMVSQIQESVVWSMLKNGHTYNYYSYAGIANSTTHSAKITISNGSSSSKFQQWSEPVGPSMVTPSESSSHQDLTFPIHNLHFRCRDQSSQLDASQQSDAYDANTVKDDDDSDIESSTSGKLRTVTMFGDVAGNWDTTIDYNAPCLVLPIEFYNSLSGWIGLFYNENLRLSELPSSSAILPILYFSLSYGARPVALPLEALVLPELQQNSSSSGSGSSRSVRRLCIQRSSSIVQNGATIFAAMDTDAGTVQRYRMQGSFSLPLYNMVQAPVVLGTMALQAIGTISVNGVNRSIAMAGRSSSALAADELSAAWCVSKQTECIGEQQYVKSTNTCKDPDCALYYFHSLDEDSKRCVMGSTWLLALCVTTAVCVSAELFFSVSSRRLALRAVLDSSTS